MQVRRTKVNLLLILISEAGIIEVNCFGTVFVCRECKTLTLRPSLRGFCDAMKHHVFYGSFDCRDHHGVLNTLAPAIVVSHAHIAWEGAGQNPYTNQRKTGGVLHKPVFF